MISPLVITLEAERPATYKEGDLVTVKLYPGIECGARITRMDAYNVWVRLVGLTVPQPYELGMMLTLEHRNIIDW